jgi:hypothetical protein
MVASHGRFDRHRRARALHRLPVVTSLSAAAKIQKWRRDVWVPPSSAASSSNAVQPPKLNQGRERPARRCWAVRAPPQPTPLVAR